MRRPLAIIAVLGATLSLAACDTGDTPDSSATPSSTAAAPVACATDGDASTAVQVTGDFGTKPAATTFSSPIDVEKTERTVISEGAGDTIVENDLVTLDYTLYNGTSGAELDASGYTDDTHARFVVSSAYLVGLVEAVNCSTVGSRVVAVVPPADAFGDDGNESLGVAAGDSLVFVIDIDSVTKTKATGTDQAPVDGFPAVVLADDGTPTVTIPESDPPTTLQTEVLKKGDGEVVADGAELVVQYQGLIWGSGKVFDQSWGSGTPSTFATGAVIDGFKEAVVGQTVGSQIVVIIPPDKGYGTDGNTTAGISGTDTLVFVIDILGVG